MPSRIAATAADTPLYYQNFKSYAQAIADKTARHGLHVSPLPEIWGFRVERNQCRYAPFELKVTLGLSIFGPRQPTLVRLRPARCANPQRVFRIRIYALDTNEQSRIIRGNY